MCCSLLGYNSDLGTFLVINVYFFFLYYPLKWISKYQTLVLIWFIFWLFQVWYLNIVIRLLLALFSSNSWFTILPTVYQQGEQWNTRISRISMSQRYHQFPTISYKAIHSKLHHRIFLSSVSQTIMTREWCQELEVMHGKKLEDCKYIGFNKMNIGLTDYLENG